MNEVIDAFLHLKLAKIRIICSVCRSEKRLVTVCLESSLE